MQPFDVLAPILSRYQSRIKNYPQHVNRASNAGHPCVKFLVLCRTNWQDKLLHDVRTQMIFELGNIYEDKAIRDLQDAGLTIIEQQKSFEMKYLELTGHLDAKVLHEGKAYPLEVKSMEPFGWAKLNCIEDFLISKKSWVQAYPAQLTLYMLAENIEYGIFYLVNKVTGQPKVIWVNLDLSYAESILKKLEAVNKHIKNGTQPEGICDPNICQYCGFLHICLPSMQGKELEVLDIEEVETALRRCEELKPLVKEYEQLDKFWKEKLKEKEKVLIGDYLITGKWIEKKEFIVKAMKYWQSKILIRPGNEARSEE